MSILISVLLVVEVLASFLLIVVILAQKSKDQGLGMAFGGGMGESLFGSRAGNVLTRMTIILAGIFMVTTILLGILFAKGQAGGSSVMDQADREIPAVPAAAPAGTPVAPQAAPVAAPMMGDLPVAAEGMSEPVVMQMGAEGELEAVETAAPAVVEEEVVSETEAEPVPEE